MSADLQEQIDALRARIDELERQRWAGPPRLGPRPETDDSIARRTQQIVDAVKNATEPMPVDRSKVCTTSGEPVAKVRAEQTEATGQHKSYIVLCAEERAKGFVRPYRDTYKHVGVRPTYPTRELTAEEHASYGEIGYVAFEPYPEGSPEAQGMSTTGRFWTAANLRSGCGTVTSMGRTLSETYARDPKFYGSTFCVGCNRHLPVQEFTWTADGAQVGS